MRQTRLPILKYQTIVVILLILCSCIATVSAADITVGSAGEDYSSINAALLNATNGDTIIVSNGTYNENIVVDREVTIRSQSGATSTILNSSSGSDTVNITVSNVTINGFAVTGASDSSAVGIYLSSNSNCTISNNIVTGNYYGIVLDSSNTTTLTGNNVSNSEEYGLILSSSNNNNLTGNNAINNHNYGISVSHSSGNKLTGNYISGDYYGIKFYYSDNNELIGNNASNNDVHGIALSSSNNNELTGNIVMDNGDYGIYLTSSSSNNLTDNNANSNYCGIRFSGSDNNYLSNNNASDNQFGIRFFSSNGNNMTGNMMSSNTYNFNVNVYNSDLDDLLHDIDDSNMVDGKTLYYWTNRADEEIPSGAGLVYLVNSTNITVKDIEVTNEYSGINIAYTTNSTIENATVSQCDRGVYLRHSDNNYLTGNNASYNDDGIYLEYSDSNNLTNNDVSYNDDDGIYFYYADNNNLTNNNASYNDDDGIYFYYADNTDLTDNNASYNDGYGMYLASSINNCLTGNNANDNDCGIYISGNYNNLTNNSANNNDYEGIVIRSSDNNNLTGNNASDNNYGICFSSSSNNDLTSNTMSSNVYNLYVSGSNLDDYLHDIDDSNMVDGRSVCYWTNRADEEVPSDSGVVYVVNSTNITVKNIEIANEKEGITFAYTTNSTIENVTISGCYDGIYLYQSDYNDLTDNNASNNNNYGIYLYYSDYNDLTDNNASYDDNGIDLSNSDYNQMISNNASCNDEHGIYLWSSEYNDMTSNDVTNNDEHGIYLRSSDYNDLTNNNVSNNNNDGVRCYYSDYNTLTDNNATYNHWNGVRCYNSDYNNLTGNNANYNDYGIHIEYYSVFNDITNNDASNNNNYGIYLASSSNNALTDNTASNNVYDFYSASSSNCVIDMLELLDNSSFVSFATDASTTIMNGSETNIHDFSGKTNVNGYTTIDMTGDMNVTFFYNDSGMSSSDESSVALYRLDGSAWVKVPDVSLNTSGDYVSATLSDFGTFGLFTGPEPTQSSVYSSNERSLYSRAMTQGTITDLSLNNEGIIAKDITAYSSNGKAQLKFGKGTTALDTSGKPVNMITITTPISLPPETPKEVLESGLYYDFGPSGTTFSESVLITIDFDPEGFEGRTPVIYTYTSEDGWVALKTTVDLDNGKAVAYIDHFSMYALFGTTAVEETNVVLAKTSNEGTEHSDFSDEKNLDGTNKENHAKEDYRSGYIYWISGIGIIVALGIIVVKKQKSERGL